MDVASDERALRRRRRLWWAAIGLPLAAAVVDWLALRSGWVDHPPAVLAVLVGIALVGLAARLGLGIADLVRTGWSASGVGGALVLAGLLVAFTAGLANWLLALQGFVLLEEGEAVPLHRGAHAQHFEEGPLARLDELDLVLALADVELRPAPDDTFYAESLIEVQRAGAEPRRYRISPRQGAHDGSLRFFQGAFGFAPRIVLLDATEVLLDEVVPFTTDTGDLSRARDDGREIRFVGSFTVEKADLEVDGEMRLDSLDEALRGHATLGLELRREGRSLGRGDLIPGHFAEVGEGIRVGFAGLSMWSEVVLTRRNYRRPVLAGLAAALAGAVLWLAGKVAGRVDGR